MAAVHRVTGDAAAARSCAVQAIVVDVSAAHQHASIALRVAERGGFRLLAELARIRLAEASLDVGDHDEAVAYVMTALAKLRKAEHRIGEAEAWAALGRIRLRLGQPDAARKCTREVETLLRETGAEPAMTRARMLPAEAASPSPPGCRAPDPRLPSN